MIDNKKPDLKNKKTDLKKSMSADFSSPGSSGPDQPGLMCHLVAGYPDSPVSAALALGFAAGGAASLEIQFPYSDPGADGPVIREACTRALDEGFSVMKGFDLVRGISAEVPIPVYIMSYAGVVLARGASRFVKEAASAGAAGLIVPDLPFDDDEGLAEACGEYGLKTIPVAVPGMPESRVSALLGLPYTIVYIALRTGITGSRTELCVESLEFLRRFRRAGKQVIAGFGITGKPQLDLLRGSADFAAVGSHFVRKIDGLQDRSPAAFFSAGKGWAEEFI